jgi:hypothetical protein
VIIDFVKIYNLVGIYILHFGSVIISTEAQIQENVPVFPVYNGNGPKAESRARR